jgi:hypothetical protein
MTVCRSSAPEIENLIGGGEFSIQEIEALRMIFRN